jgi:hypothetical protein
MSQDFYNLNSDYTEAELLEASALIESLLNAPLTRLAILIDWKRSIERARFTGKIENAREHQLKQELDNQRMDAQHAAHCCTQHGCEYGDDDCAVLLQRVAQLYPCEYCEAAKEREAEVRNWQRKNVEATPAPDHHNARRLAWREYAAFSTYTAHPPDRINMADALLTAEEARFGEVK